MCVRCRIRADDQFKIIVDRRVGTNGALVGSLCNRSGRRQQRKLYLTPAALVVCCGTAVVGSPCPARRLGGSWTYAQPTRWQRRTWPVTWLSFASAKTSSLAERRVKGDMLSCEAYAYAPFAYIPSVSYKTVCLWCMTVVDLRLPARLQSIATYYWNNYVRCFWQERRSQRAKYYVLFFYYLLKMASNGFCVLSRNFRPPKFKKDENAVRRFSLSGKNWVRQLQHPAASANLYITCRPRTVRGL